MTLSNTNNEGWCGDGDQVRGCLLNAPVFKSKRRKMKSKKKNQVHELKEKNDRGGCLLQKLFPWTQKLIPSTTWKTNADQTTLSPPTFSNFPFS